MTGAIAGVVITGERRLSAVALAERLGLLGVAAEVRPPARLEGRIPPRRPVAILVGGWSAGLADLLRRLHARGHHTIVLPLGEGDVDRMRAMKSGAADVIPHGPQQAEELALKVRRLAELVPAPPAAGPEGLRRIGAYTFDPVRRQLIGSSGAIELTPTEAVVLYCLLEHAVDDPDRRLRVPDLIAACRLPGLTPAALRKHVFELRTKLEHVAGLQVITGDLRMGLACDPSYLGDA